MAKPVGDPYLLGLKLLARRDLSAAALRARLEARGIDSDRIAATLDRLRREGALDERRAALATARTAAQVKGHGRYRALATLTRLGIPPEIAKAAIAEVYGDLDERALVERALERRRGVHLQDLRALRQAYQYLARRGFSTDVIRAVLRARAGKVADELP